MLVALSLNGCLPVPRTQAAVLAYRNSNFAEAASEFRDAITAGDKAPETLYNFGTALVAADSNESGAEALGRLT